MRNSRHTLFADFLLGLCSEPGNRQFSTQRSPTITYRNNPIIAPCPTRAAYIYLPLCHWPRKCGFSTPTAEIIERHRAASQSVNISTSLLKREIARQKAHHATLHSRRHAQCHAVADAMPRFSDSLRYKRGARSVLLRIQLYARQDPLWPLCRTRNER